MAKKTSVVLKRLNITNPKEWEHLSNIRVLLHDTNIKIDDPFEFDRESISYSNDYALHCFTKHQLRRTEGIEIFYKNYK